MHATNLLPRGGIIPTNEGPAIAENLRHPYFTDAVIREMVEDFQEELALIEIEIRKRNKTRPYPYTFQLPSKIPNSISI
jgi:arachidonate 15-lipoxygenase